MRPFGKTSQAAVRVAAGWANREWFWLMFSLCNQSHITRKLISVNWPLRPEGLPDTAISWCQEMQAGSTAMVKTGEVFFTPIQTLYRYGSVCP